MDRQLLESPFAPSEIRTRRGSHGETLGYVPAQLIIQRLNDAFEGQWSFEVIEHLIQEDEVAVLGRLSVDGIRKAQFGSSRITRSRQDGAPVSSGDDLKSAATDALKKCATLFGVGLHLYGDEVPPTAQPTPEPDAPRPATEAQIRAIYAIGSSRDLDQAQTRAKCLDGFGLEPEDLSLEEASSLIQDLKRLDRPRRSA